MGDGGAALRHQLQLIVCQTHTMRIHCLRLQSNSVIPILLLPFKFSLSFSSRSRLTLRFRFRFKVLWLPIDLLLLIITVILNSNGVDKVLKKNCSLLRCLCGRNTQTLWNLYSICICGRTLSADSREPNRNIEPFWYRFLSPRGEPQ